MDKAIVRFTLLTVFVLVIGGCGANPTAPAATPMTISESQKGADPMTFELTSSAFADGAG